MSDQPADRTQRMATAGLSAVGATAGAAGLGYAGHKLGQAYRAAPKTLGVKGRLVRAASKEKFGTALLPLEAAGLGGEIMATHILHGDTKKQGVTKGLEMEFNGSSRTGRRIVEPSQTDANRLAREAISPEDMVEKGVVDVARVAGKHAYGHGFVAAVTAQHVGRRAGRLASKVGSTVVNEGAKQGKKALRDVSNGVQSHAYGLSELPDDLRRAVRKADRKRKQRPASAGRIVTGAMFPGIHGAVAGRQNHKLKAAGYELGGGMVGGALVPGIGAPIGAGIGTNMAHEAGHYKRQDVRKAEPQASPGRKVTGTLLPGYHGAFAGRKGRKLRAVGNEVGYATAGGAAGMLAGTGFNALTRNRARLVGNSIAQAGTLSGALHGVNEAQRKGHLKPQTVGKSGSGVLRQMQALQRSSTKGKLALKEGLASQRKAQGAKTHSDFVALQQKASVGKARRFDSEADRQRRIGYIGGGALGGAIVTGEVTRRNSRGGLKMVSEKMPNGKRRPAGIAHLRMNRRGLIAAGATAGLGALSAGAFKHGVSERNKTWT